MVQVRAHHPLQDNGEINIEQWVEDLMARCSTHIVSSDVLVDACHLAKTSEANPNHESDQIWAATVSSFHTGLEMASILVELHLFDQDSLVAAILYRAVREGRLSLLTVKQQYSENVASLIESVLQMAVISTLRTDSEDDVSKLLSEPVRFGH